VVLIDTNIFMYAAGTASPHKKPSIAYLSKIIKAGSATLAYTNSEVLQEILHRYRSIGKHSQANTLISHIIQLGITILPVSKEDIFIAQRILDQHKDISTRDGIHAAVAIRNNLSKIVSYDSDFDKIDEITRIEP
jgi:predicted nucleic acid-binding protein